ESIKAKTGFLANLSHELRGPLGIMMNAVELVLDGLCGTVSEDQRETLEMVRGNGEHLMDLINDVLDYAKIESGRVVPQKTEILVNDLLKDMVGVVRAQAESKSHELSFRSSDEALAISCDKRHIRQKLINLLTNAIKYTPEGGKIQIWAERTARHKIKINVQDSGIGIEQSSRHKVFSAFERIENTYALSQVGTGLGMPLTKKLAEVNGAIIDFSSNPGQGSHFWLIFPAIEVGAQIRMEDRKELPIPLAKGEMLLLIEKDEGERKMIMRYLTHLGYKILSAGSRIEAMELLRNNKFDLAILDNSATEDNSDNIVSALRQDSEKGRLPILMITSRAFVFDIEKYLRMGIDRCLVKPLQLKQLGITCRELIDGTYTGAVIDSSDLDLHETRKQDKASASSTRTRLMELDDLLH
ncbi:MAG: response regulator, partial [Bdellovibrionales bacterium]|nr:response regulator [Bdellovibrionales bacterium]